jgi:serine/threonine-protein kinase
MAGLAARVRALPGHPDVVLMAATATCLLLLVLVSVVGLGGGRQSDVDVRNEGGSPASVSLGEPVFLSPSRPGATVTIRVAGILLPPSGDPVEAEDRKPGALSLSASQYLVAGDAEATVTAPGYSARTVIHADGGLLTVPGIGGIALLLFALAYAESLLRQVRRRRRSRGSTLAGMAVVGVVLGLAVALVGWALVGNHVLTVPLLLVAALLGNATALGLTVVLARRDPAARS